MDFGFCGSNSIRNLDQSYEIVFNLDQWEIVYKFIHIYFQFCPKVFHATVGKIASIFFDSTPFDIFIQISFPTITKQCQYDEGISMKFINIAYILRKISCGFCRIHQNFIIQFACGMENFNEIPKTPLCFNKQYKKVERCMLLYNKLSSITKK